MSRHSSMVRPLSDRQIEFLAEIKRYTAEHGFPPSFEDIADAFGIRRNGVHAQCEKLRDRGAVTWEPGKARTLRVVEVAPIAPEHRDWTCSGRCVHPHALDCEAERLDLPMGRACLCECHDASEGRK